MLQVLMITCTINKFVLSTAYYKMKRRLHLFSGPGMIYSPKKTPALTHISNMVALKENILWVAFKQNNALSHPGDVSYTHREMRQGLRFDRFCAYLHTIRAAPAVIRQGSVFSL